MRDYILFYINGKKHEVSGDMAQMTLAKYLRYEKGLTGTKIVCSEGDCGACTVLINRAIEQTQKNFSPINSCIAPLYLLDCSHIITVEGIKYDDQLHPVQESMAKNHGAQCGYCTPGFITSLTALVDDSLSKNKTKISEKSAKNYLTGNLCRCTGYKSIINAATEINLSTTKSTTQRYEDSDIEHSLKQHLQVPVNIKTKSGEIFLPTTLDSLLEKKTSQATISSGGTDLGVFINKGKIDPQNIIGLGNISSLHEIKETDDALEIGAKVTLDRVEKVTSKIECFKVFSESLHIFASPQIKNKGTLVGNIANGSPIGDSLPFLTSANALINLANVNGTRQVPITEFYLGYKDFDIKENEIITSITIPKTENKFKFYKVSNRKDLDISAVSMCIAYNIHNNKTQDICISYGGVGPTVLRIKELEQDLQGQDFSEENFINAAAKVKTLVHPLSDLRASKEYRLELAQNLLLKFYNEVRA